MGRNRLDRMVDVVLIDVVENVLQAKKEKEYREFSVKKGYHFWPKTRTAFKDKASSLPSTGTSLALSNLKTTPVVSLISIWNEVKWNEVKKWMWEVELLFQYWSLADQEEIFPSRYKASEFPTLKLSHRDRLEVDHHE